MADVVQKSDIVLTFLFDHKKGWLQALYTAHVGDSGAIIDRGGTAYRLTEDHKPYMKGEKQRIQQAGGQLVENGNRVLSNAKDDGRASMLAMSR